MTAGGTRARRRGRRTAFTLVEVLVALAILVTAFAIVWGTFSSTVQAWRSGTLLLDGLHRGDYVMEQVVTALRSAVFFPPPDPVYGFRLENREGEYPNDRFSWVTSASSFVPPSSPFARAVHRIEITIDDGPDGQPAVAVRAWPHLLDPDEAGAEPETWYLPAGVQGLDCRVYNGEDGDWDEEWEATNRVPGRVEIALYLDPLRDGQPPVVLRRAVEVPVAAATNAPGPSATAAGSTP